MHRNWLVNAAFIKELERDGSETRLFVGTSLSSAEQGLHVPVARERAQQMKDMLLASTMGLSTAVRKRTGTGTGMGTG